MTASAAIIGYGATLGVDTVGSGTYTAIAQVESVTDPDLKVTEVKMSNLDSASATHEWFPGMIETGHFGLKLVMTKTQLSTLIGYLVGRFIYHYKLTFSDGSNYVFLAFVSEKTGAAIQLDGEAIMQEFKLKITGPVTFATS